jgi:hypothetical protein
MEFPIVVSLPPMLAQSSSSHLSEGEDDGEDSIRTEEESEDMNKSSRVTVQFEEEEISVEVFMCDFKFVEFDSWIRSRFGLSLLTGLKYCNENRAGMSTTTH